MTKFEHCSGRISPVVTKDTNKSMKSWGNSTLRGHLECMIGLMASSIEQGMCKTEVAKTDAGLQITISDGKMFMTVNQIGELHIYEL
jgi:hypothetical protein